MITTFLVEHAWITTFALVALIVIGPPVGYWLVPRPQLAYLFGLASLLPIAALTIFPTSRDLTVGCANEWALPTLGAVELMANVVLFVPATLLFSVALKRPWVVLVAASTASGLVEAAQAFVPALGRSCSTNDWLANTLGSVLGVAIAALALWSRHHRKDLVTD